MADTNVSAAEVRAAGGWDSTEAPSGILEGAAYILAGDAWLNNKIGSTLANFSGNAYITALLKAAEIYFVAYLFASRPPKEDFAVGPVKSARIKGDEAVKSAEFLKQTCKELLSQAGYTFEDWEFTSAGGDDYHPAGTDDTQVDMGLAHDDSEYPFNIMGSEY